MLSAQNILDLAGLNGSATTTVAYSVRKLSSGYTGNAIMVRRSSDNATQDIGFTVGGALDVNALLVFSGSGDAFVDTWYDQSGNGKNLTQANAANQPRIVSAGSMDMENGKPFIRFFGIVGGAYNSLNLATEMTSTGHLAVVNKFATGGDGFILGHTSYHYWSSDPGQSHLIAQQNDYASSSVKASKIWQNGISIATNIAVFNTSLMVQSLVPGTANTGTTWNNIGSDRNSGHNTDGGAGYSELIVFASELNTDSRNALTRSQASYFGIILPKPDAPTNLVITPLNNGGMIHFTAPANNGGPAITNYEYSTDNGSTWTTPSPAISASPIFGNLGLNNCTSYQIKLRAVNAFGSGAESAAVTGTPSFSIDPGYNWTLSSSAVDNQWLSVTYGNGLFVAVASSGLGNRVMTSPDGITWTSRTSAVDNNWQSVTYGNGLFVAVASSGIGNRVMTSPDGINWTSRTSAVDNDWLSVTYDSGLFVAVAATGVGNRVMTSYDGITWTSQNSAADNNWQSITYGNGLFVAVSAINGTGNRVMTSSDGITWTSRTSAANNDWRRVIYGNGLFVAVSTSGTGNRVMTSSDGINWTSRISATNNNWSSVTYGNGLFVAVSGGLIGTGNRVMTSPDGITWTSRTSAADNTWRSVTYGNGLFVAVAINGTGKGVMTSSFSLVADAPVITAVNYIDNSSASLSFTQTLSSLAPAVTNYQYSTDNGANWTILSPASTTSPITVTGLASSSQIQLQAINGVGNSCPASFILNNTISSITAASSYTNAPTQTFTATFGSSITGLTSSNFSLVTTGSISGASIVSVSGSGTNYTITVNNGTGNGTIGVNFINSTGLIRGINTALPFAGETTTIGIPAVNKFGRINTSASDYLNKNGAIGTSSIVNKNGKTGLIPIPTFTVQPGITADLSTDVTYTTESGKTNYIWTIPGVLNTDYTITSGGTTADNSLTLKWLTRGIKIISINYALNGITALNITSSNPTNVGAVTVFNNLAPIGTITNKDFTNIGGWGQEFTPINSGTLANVMANIYRTNTQSGAFTLELWSSNGLTGTSALPGAKLATLSTFDWSNVALNSPTAVTTVTTFTENYNLVGGTSYWLVIKQPSNGPFAKKITSTGSGLGQTASINLVQGSWINKGSSPNLGMQISIFP
jgi:hypothetical protein